MDDEVLDVPEDAKEKVSKEFNRSISEPPKEVGHLSVNPARKLSEGEAEAAGDNLTGMFFQKLIQFGEHRHPKIALDLDINTCSMNSHTYVAIY